MLTYGLRVLGMTILAANLILDCAYLFKSTFAGRTLYALFCVATIFRFLVPVFFMIRYCANKVGEPLPMEAGQANMVLRRQTTVTRRLREEATHYKQGMMLYAAIPFAILTGAHRLLNFKNF